MRLEGAVQACVLAIPEIAAWPEVATLLERAMGKPRPDWEWPLLACQAVGGDPSVAIPGAAAIGCMYIAIILVDDLLDQDPRGEHHRRGVGPTANMALAFQAAALRAIDQAAVDDGRRAAIISSLAQMALATAAGQHLDAQGLEGEESYWRVVRAKSTPFYGAALHVGALLGGAESAQAERLRDLGALLGEIIQVQDDLLDTFQTPASPDWVQQRLSLPILYARTAEHADRARFLELLPGVSEPALLREAQQILIRSGAVSYCCYQMLQRHRQVRQLLDHLSLTDPEPIRGLWTRQMQPLLRMLSAEPLAAASGGVATQLTELLA